MRISDGTLRRFWRKGRAKGIDARSAEHLQELLATLDAAAAPGDMDQPGWDFHPLTGIARASMPSRSEACSAWCSSGKRAKLYASGSRTTMADNEDLPAGRPGFRPVHPGRIVKRNIAALGMSVEAFAAHIGTSRQTVHSVLSGRSAVGPEMAVRLARAFNTSPQLWLNMQMNHTVWELERQKDLKAIRPLKGRRSGQAAYP